MLQGATHKQRPPVEGHSEQTEGSESAEQLLTAASFSCRQLAKLAQLAVQTPI